MNTEGCLSAELLEELGGGDDMVLPSKSKKKKQTIQSVEEEKPLSKSEKRKLDQLNIKKEKELKRSGYLETLKKHQISKEHQDLLLSTRDAGQHQTTKSKLKRAYKLYKAGIDISEEDRDLLFPMQRNANNSDLKDTNEMKIFEVASKDNLDVKYSSEKEQKIQEDIGQNKPSTSGSIKSKKLGANLLNQFSKIKQQNEMKNTDKIDEKSDVMVDQAISFNEGRSDGVIIKTVTQRNEDASEQRLPYVPVSVNIPISLGGIISHSSDCKSSNNNSKNIEGKSINLKTIHVSRDEQIQINRLQLPVCGMEQEIVETIGLNDVVILCGETGSGKSTQIPQFLYETGYTAHGMIGITQPRRVAAVSTAIRVAEELSSEIMTKESDKIDKKNKKQKRNFQPKGIVGYQIRHDSSSIASNTSIKFMTDGILLKEVSKDFLLRKYSVIILDEAHERSVNTDILIGMLSRVIPTRRKVSEEEIKQWELLSDKDKDSYQAPLQPLKLVIMSATLRISDFQGSNLFKNVPPVIKVESRQFPVITHFAKRTEMRNYLQESFKKTCQIHRKLPAGGILIFLTGKKEISYMCKKLIRVLNGKLKGARIGNTDVSGDNEDEEDEGAGNDIGDQGLDAAEAEGDMWDEVLEEDENELEDGNESDITDIDDDDDSKPKTNVVNRGTSKVEVKNENNSDIQMQMLKELLEDKKMEDDLSATLDTQQDEDDNTGESAIPEGVFVLPLYAMLSAEKQKLVFKPPPEGFRLIVVATNVAETSITIPGIRYVVDCGRQKTKIVDKNTGISKYEVTWISKASADQRQGRAGRTGPGHCYRLYSSAFYDQHMVQFQEPEICSSPLEDVVLQLRALGIENEESFPFPSAPPRESITRAFNILVSLGAIKPKNTRAKGWQAAIQSMNEKLSGNVEDKNSRGCVTALGKKIAKFPINARLAKMLIVAHNTGVLSVQLSTAIVACLSERSPFLFGSQNDNVVDKDESSDDEDEDKEGEKDMKDQVWRHPKSDLLATLRALGAFAFAESTISDSNTTKAIELCDNLNMHYGTLRRISDLQKQLQSIYNQVLNQTSTSVTDSFGSVPPPTTSEEVALRQIIVTGFSDSVARRILPSQLTGAKGISRRKRLTAYMSCDPTVTTPIYIHPNSGLYKKDPTAPLPDYVVYSQLISNQRGDTIYMSGVTVINPSWLPELARDSPLIHWTEPLKYPTPFYDKDEDCIKCHVGSTYGSCRWELPSTVRNMKHVWSLIENNSDVSDLTSNTPRGYGKMEEVYRWFGRLLLEGKIIAECNLNKILSSENLVDVPSVITSLKPDKKVVALLAALTTYDIFSRRTLLDQIIKNESFLVDEIQAFVKLEMRKTFRSAWKNFVNQIR